MTDTYAQPARTTSEALICSSLSKPEEGLRSWVVVDSLVDGMAMGGTRMSPTVDEAEVRGLAAAMTTKLALAGLRIGGAKAGIRAPGPERHRDDVIDSFGRAASPLMHGGVYLGADLGTTHADRDRFFTQAGYDVTQVHRATTLPTSWAEFWEPLVDITGFGVAQAALTALAARPGGSQRVVIQGFGTVGRAVAKTLADAGHTIVAVADIEGTIVDHAGLHVPALLELTDARGTIDRSRLPESAAAFATAEHGDIWLDAACDLLVLAASGDAIREDNVARTQAQVVVEGGNLCCTAEAKRHFVDHGITLVPDVVANVGGAGVTGAVLTGLLPTGLSHQQMVHWLFDWIGRTVSDNTRAVLEIAHTQPVDPVAHLLGSRVQGL